MTIHDAPVVNAVARVAGIGPAPLTIAPAPSSTASVASATNSAPPSLVAPTSAATAAPTTGAVARAVAPQAAAAQGAPATTPSTLLPPITIPLLSPPAKPAPARAPAASAGGMAPYLGLGTWVDAYDWSILFSKGNPTVGPGHVEAMVAAGVQTLYIQASKHDSPTDVLEPELLQAIIDNAHNRGILVVVWYLPTLVDPGADLRRLKAVAGLRNIDGVAVDIEARNVADVADRNRRLIDLSAAFRREMPGRTIGGIVLPPVVMEVINQSFWPNFPYREIAPFYDVWMTMGYWTNRTAASGYRDAFRYTKDNVDRLRTNLGQPNAPVHPIGGIGNRTSAADIEGYKRAVTAVGGIGGSIYDWNTTAASLWDNLRPMRLR